MTDNPVRIEITGDKIHLHTAWDGGRSRDLAKSVVGARWNAEAKAWTYPLSWDVCVALRGAFGDRLEIGPLLRIWAARTKATQKQMAKLAADHNAKVELLGVAKSAPKLAKSLRPYQGVGAAFAANGRRVIIADEMRLGKTLESIAAVVQNNPTGNFLVIAPKTAVLATWVPEIRRWLGDAAMIVPLSGDRAKREAKLANARAVANDVTRERPYLFVVCNIEMVRITGVTSRIDMKGGTPRFPDLFEIGWQGVIVDESHASLVYKTGVPTQQRTGMVRLAHRNPDAMLIALSGTPFRGKLHQIWGTLNWLEPKYFSSYWRWVENYFHVLDNGFGKEIGGLRKDRTKAFYAELSSRMIRRTMREVRPEIPEKIYCGTPLDGDSGPVAIWLPMEPAQAKQYRQLVSEAMVETDNGELMPDGVLAVLTRAKQIANSCLSTAKNGDVLHCNASNKAEWILEKAAEGEKMVVASQFTRFLNYLHSKLAAEGVTTAMITGEVSDRERARAVEAFQHGDDPQIMLLNTKAGGVSLTLDAASIIITCDETWNPDDQAQVEARITPTTPNGLAPTVYALRSLGTIDEGIARSNLAADDIVRAVMDSRRGVSVLRQVIAP